MALTVKIGNYTVNKFSEAIINMRYDSVADCFSLKLYEDPTNSSDKAAFKPLSYNNCQLFYDNQLLITGTLLNGGYSDKAEPTHTHIGGYSITGVLEDCNIVNTPLQFSGLSIKQVAQKVADYFGLGLVVDSTVSDVCDIVLPSNGIDVMQTAKDFLSELCKQVHVTLSHTPDGKMLLTAPKTIKTITQNYTAPTPPSVDNSIPGISQKRIAVNQKNTKVPSISKFNLENKGAIWTSMELNTEGQQMYSNIYILQQAGAREGVGALQTSIVNPFVPAKNTFYAPKTATGPYRQRAFVQTYDIGSYLQLTARSELGCELKNIALTVEIRGLKLNNVLALPNNLVTVNNPKLHIYRDTQFFIEAVSFRINEKSETAILSLVLPECYNQEPVNNIFD